MKNLLELFKKKEMLTDVFNVLLGLLLCGSIVVVCMNPGNRTALLCLFFSGAGVNIGNGIKMCRDPKQRNIGYSMLLLGAVILIIGFYVLTVLGGI